MFSKKLGMFVDYLKSKGLKLSRARLTIADVLLSSKRHLKPSEIFIIAKKKQPSIGIVSVYRTISLLKKAGFIEESRFAEGESYIEPMADRPHHDHISCVRCGEVIEFQDGVIERLQGKIARKYNYKMKHHTLMIWGVCSACQKARVKSRRDRLKIKIF